MIIYDCNSCPHCELDWEDIAGPEYTIYCSKQKRYFNESEKAVNFPSWCPFENIVGKLVDI